MSFRPAQTLTPGTFSLLANTRQYSKERSGNITPADWVPTEYPLYVLDADARNNQSAWSRLALYEIAHFFDVPTSASPEDNMDRRKITRAVIGMLCLLGDYRQIGNSEPLKKALKLAGIVLQYREISTAESSELNSHHYLYIKDKLQSAKTWKKTSRNPEGPLIMVAIIMMCIIKMVNSDNEKGWIKNRINTFCGSVGDRSWADVWTDELYPTAKYLGMLNSFMSSNFSIRREIFLTLNGIALSSHENVIVQVCRDVVQLMRGSEMHHLILIDTYLMRKYPELRGLHVLRDLDDQYQRAIARLQMEKIDDVLFLRLLYSRDNTAELNRQNFKEAAVVATTCAKFDNPSFDNYFMDRSEKAQELSDLVTKYLTHRRRLSLIAIGENRHISMGEIEKEQYFKAVLDEFLAQSNQPTALQLSPTGLRTI